MKRNGVIKIVAIVMVVCILLGYGGYRYVRNRSTKYDTSASTTESKYESAEAAALDSSIAYADTQRISPDDSVIQETPSTEEYNQVQENEFLSAQDTPLSTFAADVDTASYANVRRMILENGSVEADAVRIEELINYFSYDYKEPEEGEPFSVTTEIAECPWNENAKLLQIGMQAKKMNPEEIQPSNLVFLIDVSGSMSEPDKLPLVQQAFRLLCENLEEEDRISIVTYASSEDVVLEGARGDETGVIMEAIETLEAGGSTAGEAGIQRAYELAEEYFIEDGNNRVILATDGDLNVGISSEEELTELIEEKAKSKVDLSVIGFGTGNIKDNKMEALADHGNGNYNYIDTLSEARKVLFEEMDATLFTVAKDVKFQVDFHPEAVSEYRLIGYENRKMADEDFADDTKDGGEIGAGHQVTVLYELVMADEVVDSDEWLTVQIRHKEPKGSESTLKSYPVGEDVCVEAMSDNMKFATSVAQTGMLLKDSKYAGDSAYEDILERLEEIEGLEQDDYKDEFCYLVKRLSNEN